MTCMSPESDDLTSVDSKCQSKLEMIDSVLDALELQLEILDKTGFSMPSIHLNDAIIRLRSERTRAD